jgi:hypothetical protein
VQRQLAGFGLEHLAFGRHDVAQVPVLEGGVQLLADRVARDVDLDAPGLVLQVAKLALPITRLSIMRPAIFAGTASAASCLAVLFAVRSMCSVPAWSAGLKSFGKAGPLPSAWSSRRALSFSRRSTISWLSSCGTGAAGGVFGWLDIRSRFRKEVE